MDNNNHDNNNSSIEPLIRSILIKMNKLESLDEHVQYLRSEWYITIDDLRLALQDKTQWSELQLPGRLKIELKKELIKLNTINTTTATSDTINTTAATINNTIITNNDESNNNNNNNTLQIPIQKKEEEEAEEEYNNNEIMNTPINTDSDINYDNELAEIAIGNLSPNKWLKCFSPEHECFYYVSQVSGESQWEEPDPDEEIEEDEYSMALHAESLVDSNERLQYETNSYIDENDYGNEYNDNSFQPPLPPVEEEEEQQQEQSYVYNAYESNWVYPSAPPVPIVPTVVHAIPLDTYLGQDEDIPELPISNVRRQPQQPSPSQLQQQRQSSPHNQFEANSDDEEEEEELSSDEEAYVYDNSFEVDEILVEQLVEMGFGKSAAATELNRCKNQIDIAIARLVRLNERNSRNVRVVQKQVPNDTTTANNRGRTFFGKVIGVPKVPKVPKVPINLFGKNRKNVDRSDENR